VKKMALPAAMLALVTGSALADSVTYQIDPSHTYPSFEADHFGMPKLDEHAKSAEMFDVAKYPTATYKGRLTGFKSGAPTKIEGEFTLHGVTHPLTLTINQFLCKPNPMDKKEHCGADASGTLNRADYGISYGDKYGFKMDVKLAIQVEGVRAS
jgi:polyisoprenoid-binding protein YceI